MALIDIPSKTRWERSPSRTSRTVGRKSQSVFLMALISLLLFIGMGSRLAFLQLVQGERNQKLAEENRIRLISRQAERGRILDRNGHVLASSRPSYSVFVYPIALDEAQWIKTRQRLAKILNIAEADIQKRLTRAEQGSPYLIRIAQGLSPAQVTAIKEYRSELPGIEVDVESVRNYPNGDLASHVLGYTGEITDELLQQRKEEGYQLGDIVGQMGMEAVLEAQLRGERGGQQIEVDGSGQVVRILGEKPARPGQDVQLTLDLDLQKAAEQALGNRDGAIVAIDPNTGEILAMVSRPSFDPNIFSTHITDAQWKQLQSKEFPFVNRALQGYPPASTFKIVTTTSALESGRYSPDTVLPTYPYVSVGGIQFWDWNRAGFGPLGFVRAIAMSSDTFFYQIAMGMGEKPLIEWTRRFGFGQQTGVELAEEEAHGLVPDENWKQQQLDEQWYIGDTINFSIGQGYLQTSPLQVAVMFAVPANGGYRVRPHLLKENVSAQSWREPLNISPNTIRVLREGLREVVSSGTGKVLNTPTLPPVAGKSGTAEDPPRQSHTWFGAYAPADNPKIVVVAFAENSGGGGGSVAAPMVRQVLEAYFNRTQPAGAAKTEAVNTD